MSSNTHDPGFLLVVAATSGTGKSTVCQALVRRSERATISVSYTTRRPRAGEQNGVHYHFISTAEFEAMIAENALLEWAKVHDNYYGTGRRVTEELLLQGKDVLLDIDIQGARSIRKQFSDQALLLFLLPPSWAEMERRLRGRGTESEEKIQRRLRTARVEFPAATEFDYLLFNHEVEETVDHILQIRGAERFRRLRMQIHLEQLLQQIPPAPEA